MNPQVNRKIRLGIIGIGNMGSEHCRTVLGGLCPETGLAAVADLRGDRREWARKSLPPEIRIYSSGTDLIRERPCDAVLIAVPHFRHEAVALEALSHGLDVLCEKPFAVTTSAAKRMIHAADLNGRVLALMFNQRTNCLYRAMKQALSSGMFGNIKRVSWIATDWYRTQRYYDSGSWRATWAGEGGGVLLNQCPHQLDLLIWLCGMPVLVDAKCHDGKWHRIEVEDDVSVYMEFENGATGTFIASTGDLPGTNRLEICCEHGRMICENGRVRCAKLDRSERDICFNSDNPWYRSDINEFDLDTDGRNPQHAGVINDFSAHLLRREALTATSEDGLRAVMLSNAIHYSGWSGKPVRIPVPEDAFEDALRERIAGSQARDISDITFDTDHKGTGCLHAAPARSPQASSSAIWESPGIRS